MEVTRRKWLTVSLGTALTSGVGGCLGRDNSNGTEITYEFGDPIPWLETPEWFEGTYSRTTGGEHWTWAVVEFDVTRGAIDAADIFAYTAVEVETTRDPVWERARLIRVVAPDEHVITAQEESDEMAATTQAEAYHLFGGQPDNPTWITRRLERERNDVIVVAR